MNNPFPAHLHQAPVSVFGEPAVFEKHPPIAILTLQQQLLLHEVLPTHWTGNEASTGTTVGVVILPLAVKTWSAGTTLHTADTPAQKDRKSVLKFKYLQD